MSKKIASKAQELYDKVEDFIESRDYEKALSNLNEALRIEPEYAEAMSKIGTVHTLLNFKQMSKEEVIKLSQRALELNAQSPIVWAQMGVVHIIKKEFDKAIECFQKAIDIKLDYNKAWNGMGAAYLNKKEPDKALECFQKAIDIKQDYSIAWCNMGLIHLNKKEYDKALEYSQRAIKIDPGFHHPWNNLGQIHLNKKEYDKAFDCFQKAIDIKPDYFIVWNKMGLVYLNKKEPDKALDCFQKAIDIKPDYSIAWCNLGFIYFNKKEYDKALEYFQRAIDLKPDYIIAWDNMGLTNVNKKAYDKAIECFQKVINLKPDHFKAWNRMGFVYMNTKEYDKAIECLQKALDTDSNPTNHAIYHYRIGNCLRQLGQHGKAIQELDLALNLKKDYSLAIWEKGIAYKMLEKYQVAIKYMQEYLKLKPKEYAAYYQIGFNLRKLGQYENAIKEQDHALNLKKDYSLAIWEKSIAYSELGKFQEAIKYMQEYLKLKPKDHMAYYRIGFNLRQLGQYENAIKEQDYALNLKKDYSLAIWEKGIAYKKLKKNQVAIKYMQEYLKLKPKDHMAYYQIGFNLRQLGQYENAIKEQDYALNLKKDYSLAIWEKGISYSELGKFQEAIKYMQEYLKLKPKEHAAYYQIAIYYKELDKWEECLKAINKSLELNPDNKKAKKLKKVSASYIGVKDSGSIDEQIRLLLSLDEEFPEMGLKDDIEEFIKDFNFSVLEEGETMKEFFEIIKSAEEDGFSLKNAFQSEEFKVLMMEDPEIKKSFEPFWKQIQAGSDKILPGSPAKLIREIFKDNVVGGLADGLSNVSSQMGNLEEALATIEEAIKDHSKKDNQEEVAKFLLRKGKYLIKLGENNSGINAIVEALEKFEKLGNKKGIVESLIEKGKYELYILNYETAFSSLDRAYKLSKSLEDKESLFYCFAYILLNLLESEKIEELEKFCVKNEKLLNTFGEMERIEDQELKILIMETIGRTIIKITKDYEGALIIFQAMEKYAILNFQIIEVSRAHFYEGLCYHGLQKYPVALKEYKKALYFIQKEIKGKELDFKTGEVLCPNPKCEQKIPIKMTGISGALIETCPNCYIQFSLWITDPTSSKCYLTILSEDVFIERSSIHSINLQDKKGRETSTEIANLLNLGAMITSKMALTYKAEGDYLNASKEFFQAASMYQALGLMEKSENNLRETRELFPKIETKDRELLKNEIQRLLKRTSENLRRRDFTYIFISCPNCRSEHQIQAGLTTVAIELCSKCQVNFSVFYDDNTQEFYTNILEKSKIKTFTLPKKRERDLIRFCARCGLNVGVITRFCARCGLKILRD